MSKRKFSGFGGKGYYIALVLCAAAIGVSGYLYYRNTDTPSMESKPASVQEDGPQVDVSVQATGGAELPPVNTVPAQDAWAAPQEETQVMKTAAPVSGETVAQYAVDCLSYNPTTRDWRTHNGVDIAAEAGTQVCAAADGTVYTVYDDDTMGTTVVIRHEGGYMTKYASLAEEVSVAPGDEVQLGQAIGCVGRTAILESAIGDHVHFSVSCDDALMDPDAFLSLG